MSNTIFEIISIVETWKTRDIQTLIDILQDYIENERMTHV